MRELNHYAAYYFVYPFWCTGGVKPVREQKKPHTSIEKNAQPFYCFYGLSYFSSDGTKNFCCPTWPKNKTNIWSIQERQPNNTFITQNIEISHWFDEERWAVIETHPANNYYFAPYYYFAP